MNQFFILETENMTKNRGQRAYLCFEIKTLFVQAGYQNTDNTKCCWSVVAWKNYEIISCNTDKKIPTPR